MDVVMVVAGMDAVMVVTGMGAVMVVVGMGTVMVVAGMGAVMVVAGMTGAMVVAGVERMKFPSMPLWHCIWVLCQYRYPQPYYGLKYLGLLYKLASKDV